MWQIRPSCIDNKIPNSLSAIFINRQQNFLIFFRFIQNRVCARVVIPFHIWNADDVTGYVNWIKLSGSSISVSVESAMLSKVGLFETTQFITLFVACNLCFAMLHTANFREISLSIKEGVLMTNRKPNRPCAASWVIFYWNGTY